MSEICCIIYKTQLIQFTDQQKVAKKDLNILKTKRKKLKKSTGKLELNFPWMIILKHF